MYNRKVTIETMSDEDKDDYRIGYCEKCGEPVYDPEEHASDDFGNKYHEDCDEGVCTTCDATFRLSELQENQDDDMCGKCHFRLGIDEMLMGWKFPCNIVYSDGSIARDWNPRLNELKKIAKDEGGKLYYAETDWHKEFA